MSKLFRRDLFRRAAAAAIVSGLSTVPRFAFGQGAGPRRRLVIMYFPNGSIHPLNGIPWNASGAGASFSTGALNHPEFVKHKNSLLFLQNCHNLAGSQTSPGGPVMHPINPHNAGTMTVLSGVKAIEVGRDPRFPPDKIDADPGTFGGPSIDQYLAAKNLAPLPVLNMGYKLDQLNLTITSPGARQRTLPEQDPVKAFDKVFSFAKSANGTVDERIARRRLVLADALKDVEDFAKTGPREDREKLQSHAEGLRALDADLAGAGSVACTIPGRPAQPGTEAASMQAMLDITAEAIACDITRVVTIQITRPHEGFNYAFAGAPGDHHANSHHSTRTDVEAQNFKLAANWFAGQMGYLMTKLAAVNEGGGKTALDNTAIVWVSDLATGELHSNMNNAFVIGGGLGGAVRGGRVLNVNGRTNNDMWVAMMKGMGLPDTSFGSPVYNTGVINLA